MELKLNLILFCILLIFPFWNCNNDDSEVEVPSGNLTGNWIGNGYSCPSGPSIQEVSIEDDGLNFIATKITGDACVTAGNITFSGVKNDSSEIYEITVILGSLSFPNSASINGSLFKIDDNVLKITYVSPNNSTIRELFFTRINTKVKFWINAFIPKHIDGYTQDAPPPYTGQTMIQYDIPSNPEDINQYCALTDQRTFSEDFSAKHRMQSSIEVIYHGNNEIYFSNNHDIDPTHELICDTGLGGCFQTGSSDEMKWENQIIDGSTFTIDLNAKANNPCGLGNVWSPNIDYEGVLNIDFNSNVLSFNGKIDDFPAFEAYIKVNEKSTQSLFQEFKEDNTVWDLLGAANNSINKSVSW